MGNTVMTWGRYEKLIGEGYGRGTLEGYKPWLFLRRRNPSPVSNQVTGATLPGQGRRCAFLARIEWLIALLCFWLGAIDCREQFPCWPQAHAHPLKELPGVQHQELHDSRGMWEIARDAGIEHGNYIGSNVPCPVTTDLLITLPGADHPKLVALPIKAASAMRDAEPADRMLARLELEHRYHSELNIYCKKVITEKIMTEVLAGQLVMFSAAARPKPEVDNPLLIADFAGRVAERGYKNPIEDTIRQVSLAMKLPLDDAHIRFNHLVWRRLLDIDISIPVMRSHPIQRGGEELAAALREELFGEAVEELA